MAFAPIPTYVNWQQHLKNWPDRIAHINQKDNLSDFRFIVGPDKIVFHAHKLIFAIASPEFENLFYLLQTDMEEIELPDNSSEVFEEFMDFIYKGELDLTSENVEEISKLAKLYSITILAGKCESFIQENVDFENALQFLDLSTDNNFEHATSECLKIIDENAKEICESPEFYEISKKSLDKIVESEMLSCDEIILFKAVDKWSEFECERNQKELTSENKRAIVGDTLLKIRFGAMSFEEFFNCSNEKTVSTLFTDLLKQKSLWNLKKRVGQLTVGRCIRFPHGPNASSAISLGGNCIFKISVNKNVFLCGYGVYGRRPEALETYGTATFTISLKNETSILAKTSEKINCDGTDRVYEIILKTPVLLEEFKIYNIIETGDGPNDVLQNFFGEGGKTKIEENGVTFKIMKYLNGPSKIDASTDGRIASFIFRC